MAETKDAQKENHIVEIPVEQEHPDVDQLKLANALTTISMSTAIQQHPMMEISQSPGHLLLLKLWQREENLFARRTALKETRLDSLRRDMFHLCCLFLLFHGLFSTVLFLSSVDDTHFKCKRWWVPSTLSLVTSLAMAALVQAKLFRYWKVAGRLKREKGDNRTLTRCIQELRMKGASFDLSKEPITSKRMKSSSVEIQWKPVSWCSHYFVTLGLVLFAALVFPLPKLFLCII